MSDGDELPHLQGHDAPLPVLLLRALLRPSSLAQALVAEAPDSAGGDTHTVLARRCVERGCSVTRAFRVSEEPPVCPVCGTTLYAYSNVLGRGSWVRICWGRHRWWESDLPWTGTTMRRFWVAN